MLRKTTNTNYQLRSSPEKKSAISKGNTPLVNTRDISTPAGRIKQKSKKEEHEGKLERMEQLEKLMSQAKEEMRLLEKSGSKKQPLKNSRYVMRITYILTLISIFLDDDSSEMEHVYKKKSRSFPVLSSSSNDAVTPDEGSSNFPVNLVEQIAETVIKKLASS